MGFVVAVNGKIIQNIYTFILFFHFVPSFPLKMIKALYILHFFFLLNFQSKAFLECEALN